MGLFSSRKNDKIHGFAAMVNSFTPEKRANVLKNLSKFGEPQGVLAHCMHMPMYYQDPNCEIYMSDHFLLIWQDVGLFSQKHSARIWAWKSVSHFFFVDSGYTKLYLVFDDASTFSLALGKQDGPSGYLLENLSRHIPLFDPGYTVQAGAVFKIRSCDTLTIHPGELICGNQAVFSSKFTYKRYPLEEVLWCIQGESGEDDDPTLQLYLRNGSCLTFFLTDHEEGCKIVKSIRQFAPHVLYGPSQYYDTLYRTNRTQLMAVGRAQEK